MSALSALWGKSSWFGGPGDSTTGSTTASGAPITTPGIAVYNRATLGGYWAIKAPNGNIGIVKQTDIGPAPSTGRKFDYTYSLLPLFGYTQKNFPTGGQTYGYYLGKDIGAAGPAFQTALSKLGATPTQQAGLTQSVDVGAIEQGHSAVVVGPHQAAGTTIPSMGQTQSGSSAVASHILPSPDISGGLSGIWSSIVGDAKYAAVLVGVLALGVILMVHGLSGDGEKKTRVVPV